MESAQRVRETHSDQGLSQDPASSSAGRNLSYRECTQGEIKLAPESPQPTVVEPRLLVEGFALGGWATWWGKNYHQPEFMAMVSEGICPGCMSEGQPAPLVPREDGWSYCTKGKL